MAINVAFTPSVVTFPTTGQATFTMTDNTTGYGTRSNFGVTLLMFKTNFDGTVNSLVTTDNGTAQTATIWTVNFLADGWYQGYYVAAPIWSSSTTYNLYDVVYDPTSTNYYQSLIASNTNNAVTIAADWALIPVLTIVANIGGIQNANNLNGTTGAIAILNLSQYPNTQTAFGKQTGLAFLEESFDANRTYDVLYYHLLELAVEAMYQLDLEGNYASLEKIARRAETLIYDNFNSNSNNFQRYFLSYGPYL